MIALLLVVTAAFSWINHVLIRLPHTIGLLIMGLAASLLLISVEVLVPSISFYESIATLLEQLDFREAVLNGMLAFLLFAGSLHVDLLILRNRALPVFLMATAGTLISTVVIGLAIWQVSGLVGVAVSLPWSFVFGALISPTDPVAVLSILKSVNVPQELEADMAGESLFNDGIGVVAFTVLVAVAAGGSDIGFLHVSELFLVEAVGGALLGLIAGYIAYRATRYIDNYPIETLISLALVTGTYAVAAKLHTSGPIAVVVAGILLGNRSPKDAMSDETQEYLFAFWTLIDEILNSVLFLLIGLEVIVLTLNPSYFWLALAAIPLSLIGRFFAVAVPITILKSRQKFVGGTVPILIWGGLRGGISIALALSLPDTPERAPLLAATYGVVLFTIVVQGLSLRKVIGLTLKPQKA